MAVEIKISVTGTGEPQVVESGGTERLGSLEDRLNEMIAQMGNTVKPFPESRIGGYMSHFIMTWEFLRGEMQGQMLSLVSPPAAQTVAWSKSFRYEGPEARHSVEIPVPAGSKLPSVITEDLFANRPEQFFQVGQETLWLQILNLDARMNTDLGPMRIILGETLFREHPDLFQPSLGIAQSLGKSGFPANLYFNPIALIETPFGMFRATHGTLTYGRVTDFPPIGTPVTISDCVPVESVDELRANFARPTEGKVEPIARIIALSHPIDMPIQLPGEETYMLVERAITAAQGGANPPPASTAP